jgi:Ca2+-binding EF-hand superfamily protein
MIIRTAGPHTELHARKTRAALRAKKQARSLNAEALVQQHSELLSSMTPAQEASLRATFVEFAGPKGFLMPKDMSNALHSLADDISDDELHHVLEVVGSSRIGFDEFAVRAAERGVEEGGDGVGWGERGGRGERIGRTGAFSELVQVIVGLRARQRHSAEDILAAFSLFDPEGTGFITVGMLRQALHDLTTFPEEDIEELIRVAAGGVEEEEEDEEDEEEEDEEGGGGVAAAKGGGRHGRGSDGGEREETRDDSGPGVGRPREGGDGKASRMQDSRMTATSNDDGVSMAAHADREPLDDIDEEEEEGEKTVRKPRRPSHIGSAMQDSGGDFAGLLREAPKAYEILDDDILIDYEAYVDLLLSM